MKWMVTVIGKSPNSGWPFAVNMYQEHIHKVIFFEGIPNAHFVEVLLAAASHSL